VRAVGTCRDRSTCLCTDGIGLYVCFNVTFFIPCQWAIDAICVSFDPMEAKCNPLVPSNNEILNSRNEVPVTSCVMEYTSDFGRLAAVTADLLSHINLIDRMFMVPERNSVPRTARPATNPPSSDRYDVISDWIPSSGPPPRRRIVSSFVAKTQPWYPTPNSNDPSVAMIRYAGSSKSNCVGVGSSGMLPVSC
jgi:hypothetical protein